jgi:hypothetical protein
MKQVIKQIFTDHWPEFEKKYEKRIRPVVKKEVEKLLRCGDLDYGYIEYNCPECGEIKKVGFTCKSRLCTSCGKVKTDKWQEGISTTIGDVKHRHMVFTIPEELREIFQKDRSLLKILAEQSAEVVLNHYRRRNKTKKNVPGVICAIHTFGRDLKWNPHVHMLITEGVIVDDEYWKEIDFIPYEVLRNSWQYLLLREIQKKYKGNKQIQKIVDNIYKEKDKGLYVYAEKRMMTGLGAAKYIGRYISRPAIAESRIIAYDGANVTFWYERHEDGTRVEETISAEEFIGKIIMHVPERQFKQVRYYGIYARRVKTRSARILEIVGRRIKTKVASKNWKERIEKAFGVNPLICEKCGTEMEFTDIYYWKCGSLLEKIYENMQKKLDKEIAEEEKRMRENRLVEGDYEWAV